MAVSLARRSLWGPSSIRPRVNPAHPLGDAAVLVIPQTFMECVSGRISGCNTTVGRTENNPYGPCSLYVNNIACGPYGFSYPVPDAPFSAGPVTYAVLYETASTTQYLTVIHRGTFAGGALSCNIRYPPGNVEIFRGNGTDWSGWKPATGGTWAQWYLQTIEFADNLCQTAPTVRTTSLTSRNATLVETASAHIQTVNGAVAAQTADMWVLNRADYTGSGSNGTGQLGLLGVWGRALGAAGHAMLAADPFCMVR